MTLINRTWLTIPFLDRVAIYKMERGWNRVDHVINVNRYRRCFSELEELHFRLTNQTLVIQAS